MQDVLKCMTEHQEPALEEVKQMGDKDDKGLCSTHSKQLISAIKRPGPRAAHAAE